MFENSISLNVDKIPKIIHYCWFGNKKKSKLIIKCISSWKKCLPNYKIIEWNEKNTDLNNPFVQLAYKNKKWAFVSDFVRLNILYEHGGIYLDTDMIVIKSFDNLLNSDCFFGAENEENISCGIIGAVKKNSFIKQCIDKYADILICSELNWASLTIPLIITELFREKYDFKSSFKKNIYINNIVIYSSEYFYSFPFNERYGSHKHFKFTTEKSYAVHLWNESWVEYNEFHYLRNKLYYKGLIRVLQKIISQKKLSIKYLKKIISSIKFSFKNYE